MINASLTYNSTYIAFILIQRCSVNWPLFSFSKLGIDPDKRPFKSGSAVHIDYIPHVSKCALVCDIVVRGTRVRVQDTDSYSSCQKLN